MESGQYVKWKNNVGEHIAVFVKQHEEDAIYFPFTRTLFRVECTAEVEIIESPQHERGEKIMVPPKVLKPLAGIRAVEL